MDQSNQNSKSLNKFISETGLCSRREADEWIANGRVRINGKVARKGNRVVEGDEVLLDGKKLNARPTPLYIAFNKPVGIVSTTDPREKQNIISYINHPQRLFPIGRLDKASEGLIFLTNDGDIVNKILRAGNEHEKEYIVSLRQSIGPGFLKKMSQGVPILDTVTQPCIVEKINKDTFRIILTQGLNRQIRRMCEYLGYDVRKLKRVRIMSVKLGKLRTGEWREMNKSEMKEIFLAVAKSSKTEEASRFKKGKA